MSNGKGMGARPGVTETRPIDPIPIEEIRERAYALWERNHCPHGFEVEFWLLAQQELRAERQLAAGGDKATPSSGEESLQSG